jgi:hypothetical protein
MARDYGLADHPGAPGATSRAATFATRGAIMKRYYLTLPMLLGLCLATPTLAQTAAPPATFDGAYRGSMEQAPSGLNAAYTGPDCVTMRPAAAVIRNGYVYMSYRDWHHHLIHYRGQVNTDGLITASHRDRSGFESPMTGNIMGNQLTADIQRDHGKCYYTVELMK